MSQYYDLVMSQLRNEASKRGVCFLDPDVGFHIGQFPSTNPMQPSENLLENHLRDKSRALRDQAHRLETLADQVRQMPPKTAEALLCEFGVRSPNGYDTVKTPGFR